MSRPVSLEPLHGHTGPHQQITIAPNLQPKKHEKPTGITIRTSRHWVLPPRPKPGRKPSPSLSIKQQLANVKGMAVESTTPASASSTNAKIKQEPVESVKEVENLRPGSKKHLAATVIDSGKSCSSSDQGTVASSTTTAVRTGVPTASSSSSSSSSTIPLTNCKSTNAKSKAIQVEQTTSITHTQPKPIRAKIAPAACKKQVMPIPTLKPSAKMESAKVKPQVKMEQLDVTLDHIQSAQPVEPKKKPGSKTALKKEIKILKMENNKLKKELTDLVGNLQELKRQFPIVPEESNSKSPHTIVPSVNSSVPMQQKILPKPMTNKSYHEPVHVKQEHTERLPRKRSIIDNDADMLQIEVKPEPADDTEIFLKFDEDDEPNRDFIKNLSSSRMVQTSSLSSRASLTDEDDLLLSSSTPSSLFSTDLNRTVSNQLLSNSSTLTNTGSSPSSSHTSNKSLPNSQFSDTTEAMKFLDGYEQMEFYSKYKLSTSHSQEPLKSIQKLKVDHHSTHQDELDCIKEEDPMTDTLANSKAYNAEQDASMLYFLQKHALTKNPGSKLGDLPIDLDDSLPSSLLLKLSEDDENSFMNLNLNSIDPDDPLSEHVNDTPFVAPTLEELMEEQDDKDSKLLGPENTEQDMDLLKMGIFFSD